MTGMRWPVGDWRFETPTLVSSTVISRRRKTQVPQSYGSESLTLLRIRDQRVRGLAISRLAMALNAHRIACCAPDAAGATG